MRCRHQELLWKEYLRDPSLWWDFRNTKTSPGAPDFQHKYTQEPLWLQSAQYATRMTGSRATLNETNLNWTIKRVPTAQNDEGKGKEEGITNTKRISSSITTMQKKVINVPTSRSNEWRKEDEEGKVEEKKKQVKQMKSENALSSYQEMQQINNSPLNGSHFVALIKACANGKDIENGCELHSEFARIGLLDTDPFIGSSLLEMYIECGFVAKAEELFKELRIRDRFTWNALLGGYIKWGQSKKALDIFEQMQVGDILTDAVTFGFTLKACCSMGALDKAQVVHFELERKGLLERDLFVASVLVDMYAKCGLLTKSQEVLDRLPLRDVVCWTALITGYAEHGHADECLDSLKKMKDEGISPNAVTLICCLKACSSLATVDRATEIHAEIERQGLLEKDHLLGSALVDMYAKGGSLVKAQETFDTLSAQNVVTWTALSSAYVELGHFEEAINAFEQMHANSVSPDAIAFIFSLKACGRVGATDKGLGIHAEIERQGLSKTDHAVGNALVDMYARCGSLATALCVFENLPVQGIVAWNSLIAGYAQMGESESVFGLFERMLKTSVKPDLVTFVIVLDVCSQGGLYNKGETYFKAMMKEFEILPVLEHHTCMLDLLGRAGLLEKAVALIKKLPILPDLAVWHTVLGACLKWGNVTLGREAFQHAVDLDEKDGAAYVMMSSIYANANMKEEAKNIEQMRLEKQAWTRTGHC